MTETVATDWAAAVQPLRELFDRLVAAVRSFLTALGELFRRWWRVMSPTLRTIADMERRHRAQLSRMHREYHRRRR